jgi:HAD superfamily hydrolase (TIGR01509 family)
VVEPEVYVKCIGGSWEATRLLLTDALGGAEDYEALAACWERRYQVRIDAGDVRLKPGAIELLTVLQDAGIPRGLATSTRRATATAKLSGAGILPSFSCLICGGETQRGKPHPDPYLAAVAGLGTPAHLTWALEDSENGVRAARAAGLWVIQVPDLVPPSTELLALGHAVADSLLDVVEMLRSGPLA